MQVTLPRDITISGTEDQVEKAKKVLAPLVQVSEKVPLSMSLGEDELRMSLQDTIDMFNITAMVVHKGHRVWSRKRIINNLHKVKVQGPEHLSNYFYEFIKEVCGSKLYFNKAAWIKNHSTVDAFGKFFLKNDYGKDACDYIPEWKADAKRIVEDIQRFLFPFQSYVRSKRKSK
jgi:hypothetical protein